MSGNRIVAQVVTEYQRVYEDPYGNAEIPLDCHLPFFDPGTLSQLCLIAANELSRRETVIDVPGGAYIVGDLHGNIHDLFRILSRVGDLTTSHIVFLGDYVDRGEFSIEVATLLLALTCFYPENVFLLRGNHEFARVNESYGFRQQVLVVYDAPELWMKFNSAFAFLPLAAVVGGRTFCVHGGIAPDLQKIDELRAIQRPLASYSDDVLFNLMWGDPTLMTEEYRPSPRGSGVQFGRAALSRFLSANGLTRMIRAHQCVYEGVEAMFEGKLYTVFASSNYGEMPGNKCGYVREGEEMETFKLEPYPTVVQRDEVHFMPVKYGSSTTIHALKSISRMPSGVRLTATRSSGSQVRFTGRMLAVGKPKKAVKEV